MVLYSFAFSTPMKAREAKNILASKAGKAYPRPRMVRRKTCTCHSKELFHSLHSPYLFRLAFLWCLVFVLGENHPQRRLPDGRQWHGKGKTNGRKRKRKKEEKGREGKKENQE